MNEQLVTSKEASALYRLERERLGLMPTVLAPSSLRAYHKRGLIPAHRIGNQVLFYPSDVRRFARQIRPAGRPPKGS